MNKWYSFNDQEVREVFEEDVEKSFGLKYGDATAYLLMYRRHEQIRQITHIDKDVVPAYLIPELEQQREGLIKEQSEIYE